MTDDSQFYLSQSEQRALIDLLREIPEVAEALAAAVTADGYRQNISYQPKVHGSGESPLPYDSSAEDASHALWSELGMWVQMVEDYREIPYEDAGTTVGYARWLDSNVVALAMVPGCETAHQRIADAIKTARRTSRRPTTDKPRQLNPTQLEAARTQELSASGIATAAAHLGHWGEGLTRKRVNNLRQCGHIAPVRTFGKIPIYLFGEVIDAHLTIERKAS